MTTKYHVTDWHLAVYVGRATLGMKMPRPAEVSIGVNFDNEQDARDFEAKVRALLEEQP